MFIDKKDLVVRRESISVETGVELNVSKHRFQSWFMRLAKILLMLYFKTH